ncbi:MAG: efflux transporter periplasmic adaptor subunit, partial [Odoribacter sp.]|nr:efflux transporter periplasmic adaptor subunit [Odoribacter sp.]
DVTPSDENIRTLIFISDGTYAVAKDVKTGIQDNSFIEITSGIKEGDQIITAPFSAISKKLSDSTLIQAVKKEELFKIK